MRTAEAAQLRRAAGVSPLEAEIRRRIQNTGSLPIWQYMELCLTHPEHGYYSTRAPIGAGGDFTTAPEVSQMFGELIGVWAAAAWGAMGSPESVRLVELGPGRGSMILDALRAAKVMPAFRAAVVLHMVEISEPLERLQRECLRSAEVPVHWHRSLADVPGGPLIILANEFIDALPIRQFVMCADGWHERVVKTDDHNHLHFSIDRDPMPLLDGLVPAEIRQAKIGGVFEWRSDRIALEIGSRVAKTGGVALIIDYGHTRSMVGDTLQAVSGHAFADPLLDPGSVDLTAHVDFQALAAAAESMGARVHGPVTQAQFLRSIGIAARVASLKAAAPPDHRENMDAALDRLTNEERTGMGRLIKVIAFSGPKVGPLAGFDA
jgi:NADH dehydrogenase [ubiquinone] 1 alpha subcomplex assembly factor 7